MFLASCDLMKKKLISGRSLMSSDPQFYLPSVSGSSNQSMTIPGQSNGAPENHDLFHGVLDKLCSLICESGAKDQTGHFTKDVGRVTFSPGVFQQENASGRKMTPVAIAGGDLVFTG